MQDTHTGTPQGGILSPLIFNVVMSRLDEHVMSPWKPGAVMSTESRRANRRRQGLPTWRLVRYADDLVILVHGTEADTQALREDVATALARLGLRLSEAKTPVVHMADGFDFPGFRLRWKRKGGTNKWYVYTFIADRPIRSLKAKIRALTHRTSQQNLRTVLIRLNQIMLGWANHFKHAVAKHRFASLDDFTWCRLIRTMPERHRRRRKDVRRWLTTPDGRWRPISADGTALARMTATTVSRYRNRGARIPTPWSPANPA